jgi:6-phosphogluconolactonase (cycloisomerase 2 family)
MLHSSQGNMASRFRRATLLLTLVLVSCQTSQCQHTPGTPGSTLPAVHVHFIQALSASGNLVESYRFDPVRKVPIPDSYSVLPTTVARRFVDRRHQRVFHINGPGISPLVTATPYEMEPMTGLLRQSATFTIDGDIVAAHPNGSLLFTREAPDAMDPTHSRVHARQLTGPPLAAGPAVTSLLPANASFIFSTDGAHAYVVNGSVRERPQGVTGEIFLTRCDFDIAARTFGACDTPMSIDVQAFRGPCTGNFSCERKGYDAESLAIDPQMRLLYVTAVASIAHGGSISFNRETVAVQIGADRRLVATSTQRLPNAGAVVAEPHGKFLLVATESKLESWAIDEFTLSLSNTAGASGLGEPARTFRGPMSMDCDEGGTACAVFSSVGLQLFLWNPTTSTFAANGTPMPAGVDNVDVWLATGPNPLRVWPQDVLVGSSNEPRVDLVRFDLLGAVQNRNTLDLRVSGWPMDSVGAISPLRGGNLCVALSQDPTSNSDAFSQQVLVSGTSMTKATGTPRSGGQRAFAREPSGSGRYELIVGVMLSAANDCSGSNTFTLPVPGTPRHLAVDPLGRRLYVMSFIDGRVTVLPINRNQSAGGAARPFGTPTTVTVAPPGSGLLNISDFRIDERGERLFATIGNRDQLLIIDLDANGIPQLPAQVRNTGRWPAAVAISPDNRNLYVLNVSGRSIDRFGAAPGFVATGSTPLPAFANTPQLPATQPRAGLEVAATGQLLYVSDHDRNEFQLWGISDTDGSLNLRTSVPMPGSGRILAIDRRF